MKRFLFIGDKPSTMAQDKDIVWADGGLAAKQLFDALLVNEIEPDRCVFLNLFGDRPDEPENEAHISSRRVSAIRALAHVNRLTTVAMGRKVSERLTLAGIEHVLIVHPAARGSIRGKGNYAAHIKERLVA